MNGLLAAGEGSWGQQPAGSSTEWRPPSAAELQEALPGYEICAFIARGGMGAVYKGRQRALNRTVAIKVLPPGLGVNVDMQFAARFKQEAQAMARLSHPNIVTVFDAGETPRASGTKSQGGLLYFVMEHVEGTDVAQMIAKHGRLSPAQAGPIITAVCEALAFAHEEGIIHRDIKPSNIMVDARGRVKVADFGLAKVADMDHSLLTRSDVAIGTPDFIAPEMLTPGMQPDARVDIYAVGVMLYQMLTGRIPRGRFAPPSGISPEVDARFDKIVDKAMQADREQRYSTAHELKSAVETAAQKGRRHAAPGSPDKQPRRQSRNKTLLPLGLAVIAAGSATAIFLTPGKPQPLATTAVGSNEHPSADGLAVSEDARWDPAISRAAARTALGKGASITIQNADRKWAHPATAADLPDGDFKLIHVQFPGQSSAAQVTSADALQVLQAKELRLLFLQQCGNAVNADVCTAIGAMPELAVLSLQQTGVRDEWLGMVAKAPRLDELILNQTAVGSAGIARLAACVSLAKLAVIGCKVRAETITHLPFARSLKKLQFGETGALWLDEDVRSLIQSCDSLETITLTGTVSADALQDMQRLKHLSSMAFVSGKLTARHVAHLAFLPALSMLRLENMQVEAEAWRSLPSLKGLRLVQLKQMDRTARLAAALDEFPMKPEVEWLDDQGVWRKVPFNLDAGGRNAAFEHRKIDGDALVLSAHQSFEEPLVAANCAIRVVCSQKPVMVAQRLILRNQRTGSYFAHFEGGEITIGMHSYGKGGNGDTGLLRLPWPRKPGDGDEMQMQFTCVRDKLLVTVNGVFLGGIRDDRLSGAGVAQVAAVNGRFKNLEVLNLTGLPEADALKAAGLAPSVVEKVGLPAGGPGLETTDAPRGAPPSWRPAYGKPLSELASSEGSRTFQDGWLTVRGGLPTFPVSSSRGMARVKIAWLEESAGVKLGLNDTRIELTLSNSDSAATAAMRRYTPEGYEPDTPQLDLSSFLMPGNEAELRIAWFRGRVHGWIDGRSVGSLPLLSEKNRISSVWLSNDKNSQKIRLRDFEVCDLDGFDETEAEKAAGLHLEPWKSAWRKVPFDLAAQGENGSSADRRLQDGALVLTNHSSFRMHLNASHAAVRAICVVRPDMSKQVLLLHWQKQPQMGEFHGLQVEPDAIAIIVRQNNPTPRVVVERRWKLFRERKPGEEMHVQFVCVGDKLLASVDGFFVGGIQHPFLSRQGDAALGANLGYFKDAEVLDLSGQSETEALMAAGLDPAVLDQVER